MLAANSDTNLLLSTIYIYIYLSHAQAYYSFNITLSYSKEHKCHEMWNFKKILSSSRTCFFLG